MFGASMLATFQKLSCTHTICSALMGHTSRDADPPVGATAPHAAVLRAATGRFYQGPTQGRRQCQLIPSWSGKLGLCSCSIGLLSEAAPWRPPLRAIQDRYAMPICPTEEGHASAAHPCWSQHQLTPSQKRSDWRCDPFQISGRGR